MAVLIEAARPDSAELRQLLPLRAAAALAGRCAERATAILERKWPPAPKPTTTLPDRTSSKQWSWNKQQSQRRAAGVQSWGRGATGVADQILNADLDEVTRDFHIGEFYAALSEVVGDTVGALRHAQACDDSAGYRAADGPPSDFFPATIQVDIDHLVRLGSPAWTDSTPVPEHAYGPLWPDELAGRLPDVISAVAWLFDAPNAYTPQPTIAWSLVVPAVVGYPTAIRAELAVGVWGNHSAREFTWDEIRQTHYFRGSLSALWGKVLAAKQRESLTRLATSLQMVSEQGIRPTGTGRSTR